jgi:hypothetical protein
MTEQEPTVVPETRPRISRRAIIATLVLIPIGLALFFSLYLANTAGELPWQTDPTRIPVTPFANLPTTVPATGTPTGS